MTGRWWTSSKVSVMIAGRIRLDSVLGVCAGATSTHSVSVTAKLDEVAALDLQDLLESASDLHQGVLAAGLALCSCPQSDSVEAFSDIDNDAHDLIVTFVFKGFADGSKLCMKPEFVNVDQLLVLELV